DLFQDMSGSRRLYIRRQNIELSHDFMESVGILLDDFHGFEFFEPCPFRYFVFSFVRVVFQVPYVADVPHIPYLIADIAKVSGDHIEGEESPDVAEVNIVVHRWSADVDSDITGIGGLEDLFLST